MPDPDPLDLCIRLSQAQAAVAKRLDQTLGGWHGVSFADYQLLAHLAAAPDTRLRRVDLAAAVGLSASGVTRALGPLERIGLVTREANPRDARVAYAALTDAGRQLVRDVRNSAALTAEELFAGPGWDAAARAELADLLWRLGARGLGAADPA